jgi:hypothetical protein
MSRPSTPLIILNLTAIGTILIVAGLKRDLDYFFVATGIVLLADVILITAACAIQAVDRKKAAERRMEAMRARRRGGGRSNEQRDRDT